MASLSELLNPEIQADPYPLYERLRTAGPVAWDPFLHAFVVTSYAEVMTVLRRFSAQRTPTPDQLRALGLSHLEPIAQIMVRQMLFLDPPPHTRLRELACAAFSPAQVTRLREHIQNVVDDLLRPVLPSGRMDVIADLADPLPATITAEMLGVPVSDREQLKAWSLDFAEMLGNFQHNPGEGERMLRTVNAMARYFGARVVEQRQCPNEGLIGAFVHADLHGDRLTEDEVVANSIITMTGGQETTTNLIGNGFLTLLRNPDAMGRLWAEPSLIPQAIEEMLRYESPVQYTARLAPDDLELGGKRIGKRQAVIAVLAAANRDPQQFTEPQRFDIARVDNRHVAFGWATHYCFGAALARAEAHIVFQTLLSRIRNVRLEPAPLTWRKNMGFRGLVSLPITFEAVGTANTTAAGSLPRCERLHN